MKRLMVVLVSLLVTACTVPLHERLDFEFEPGWKLGHNAEIPNKYSISEFIREGDDINNWKELLTVQKFVLPWGGSSPEDALNGLKAIREKNCPSKGKKGTETQFNSSLIES